jgi:hypothetical protein
MPLYRTLERLIDGAGLVYEKGIVDPLKKVPGQVIVILLEKQRIVEVKSPPLRVLPGWEEKAAVLEPLGIEDVSQLVDADLDEVAKELDVPVKGLRQAVQDAQSWLTVEGE